MENSSDEQIRAFLEEKVQLYNRKEFIPSDPIQVPHLFHRKEDIEIAAFFTATIAWGQRITIISNARRLLEMMPGGPYHFISTHCEEDLDPFLSFVHRTFNGLDLVFFLKALKHIYTQYQDLESVFEHGFRKEGNVFGALSHFRRVFFKETSPGATGRHVSDVTRGSAAKRLNMFLRWMVRKDISEVDFGIWTAIPTSALMIPLDVHSASTARKLGLLTRKQNDWKAVEELTINLRRFDPLDPVKYDYALFGLGVFEKF